MVGIPAATVLLDAPPDGGLKVGHDDGPDEEPEHVPELPDDADPGVEPRHHGGDDAEPGQGVLQGKLGLERPEGEVR